MITLLRRIRKSLIISGSARKSLLYAIGEIALVVIGILIALQVNNWNESRKDRTAEAYYLDQLKQEIEYNLARAEYGIEESDKQHFDAKMILTIIERDTVISSASELAYAIEHTGWSQRVTYVDNIWQELMSTGHIALIRDSELRRELSDMHRGFERSNFNKQFNAFNNGFRRIAGDIIKASVRPKLSKGLIDSTNEKIQGLDSPLKIQKALRDKEGLTSYLADIIMVRDAMKENYSSDIQKMNQVLTMIEEQLK